MRNITSTLGLLAATSLVLLGAIPRAVVRPPLLPITDAEHVMLRAALIDFGLI